MYQGISRLPNNLISLDINPMMDKRDHAYGLLLSSPQTP